LALFSGTLWRELFKNSKLFLFGTNVVVTVLMMLTAMYLGKYVVIKLVEIGMI